MDWQIDRKWSCADAISGEVRWVPDRWDDVRFTRQNVWFLHMDPPKIGSDPICIKNVICKTAFWWNFSSDAFCFHIFTKMCSPLRPEAHFWKSVLSKMPSQMLVLSHFWMHWPFQSSSVGPSSATKNQKKCCSREGLEHFFDLRPFFNHNLQFIFAISFICLTKFDFWCLLAWFFFNFLQCL